MHEPKHPRQIDYLTGPKDVLDPLPLPCKPNESRAGGASVMGAAEVRSEGVMYNS